MTELSIERIDEEMRNLRAANRDLMNHFNALKEERDELLTALKAALDWIPAHVHSRLLAETAIKRTTS